MVRSRNWPDLLRLATTQGGCFSLTQALELGFSTPLLQHHLRTGKLQRARRGIFRVAHLPAAEDEDLVVVWLWSKQRGVFSYRTALALHGLSDALPAGIDLTLPLAAAKERRLAPDRVSLHLSDLSPDEQTWVGNVPVTTVLRTLRDCAAMPVSPDLLLQALHEAKARGLVARRELDALRAQVG
ncbi:MAG: hypothetical protein FJ265_12040 [Planctomycetes bacterium]|nr:hypothetical protein [Planctomycetota bacterium]